MNTKVEGFFVLGADNLGLPIKPKIHLQGKRPPLNPKTLNARATLIITQPIHTHNPRKKETPRKRKSQFNFLNNQKDEKQTLHKKSRRNTQKK